MPILDIQRRVHEIGRIRIGEYTGDRPRALDTFRFTSPRRDLLERAAAMFGGEVVPWENQHQVVTHVDTLDVLVPPEDVSFSQWWETWSAGGCARRCDGVREVIHDTPCVCVANGNRVCDPITRLSVILPAFATFGVWRLETGSWYAAGELASAVQLALQLADIRGGLSSAVLRIEHRAVKRPGQPPNRFTVPVLDVQLAPVHLTDQAPEIAQTANGGQTLGPASLTTAGLPPPAPKVDRGAPSPPPAPTIGTHDDDTPPALPTPGGEPPLAFTQSDGPPADPNKPLRNACFALVRDVFKDGQHADVDADTLRAALAVLETAKRRDAVVTSWNDLDRTELSGVSARLGEIKRGQLGVAPDDTGRGVVFTTLTGRQAHVFQDEHDAWTFQLHEGTNDGTT